MYWVYWIDSVALTTFITFHTNGITHRLVRLLYCLYSRWRHRHHKHISRSWCCLLLSGGSWICRDRMWTRGIVIVHSVPQNQQLPLCFMRMLWKYCFGWTKTPAWTQEAYRPPCSKCSGEGQGARGGTYLGQLVPTLRYPLTLILTCPGEGGPTLAEGEGSTYLGYPLSWPGRGWGWGGDAYLGWGGGTYLGISLHPDLAGVYLPWMGDRYLTWGTPHVNRQTPVKTTSRHTTYAGGNDGTILWDRSRISMRVQIPQEGASSP